MWYPSKHYLHKAVCVYIFVHMSYSFCNFCIHACCELCHGYTPYPTGASRVSQSPSKLVHG